MDLSNGYFFNPSGYPRSAPSIFDNIVIGANMIIVLSHPICVYRLEYAYFQISRYTS